MDERPDHALVRSVLAGNVDAFQTLVERHMDAVRRHARYLGTPLADVDDVAQEAFIRACSGLAKIREPRAFGVWLHAIAAKEAYRHLRRRARVDDNETPMRDALPEIMADPADTPDTHATIRDAGRILAAALAQLPDRMRVAVLMRAVEDAPYASIAQALSTSVEGARKLHGRGVDRIRTWLTRSGYDEDVIGVVRQYAPPLLVGSDVVQRVMTRVRQVDASSLHPARPSAATLAGSVAALVAIAALWGAAYVDLEGGGSGPPGAPDGTGDASGAEAAAELAQAPSPAPRLVAPTAPAMVTMLDPSGAATGWETGTEAYDSGLLAAPADDPAELRVLSATGIFQDVEPVHGTVILDVWARPPYRLHAEAAISLEIAYGEDGNYVSSPEVIKTYDNWWVCSEDDPLGIDAERTEFRPRRRLAQYTGERTRIRLVHYTQSGEYDIYIGDDLVAERVQRRWAAGLPVTGVYARSGDGMWPGTGKLMTLWDLHLVAEPVPGRPPGDRKRLRYGSLTGWTLPNVADLSRTLDWTVKLGNLSGIEGAHQDASTFFPEDAVADRAQQWMDAIVAPARARVSISNARLASLRQAVRDMPSGPDLAAAEPAFRAWADEHAGVTEMWVDHGEAWGRRYSRWSVRLPAEDYRGSAFLYQIAVELATAYQRLSGSHDASVSVHPPTDLVRHALVEVMPRP